MGMTVQELIDELMKVDIEGIIVVIICLWVFCALLSSIIYADRGDDADWSVIALFSANLIYMLKAFWRSIIKAIKS